MRKSPQASNYMKQFTFKEIPYPSDMCLIVDTREQHSPLFLDKPPKGLMVMRDALKDGDYGIKGLPLFAVEKKYYGDLFPYCSKEMDAKTIPKMKRFKKMIDAGGWVGLVIENSMSEIFRWQQYTDITPESVRGALVSFAIKYHIHVHFGIDRERTARWILDHAVKYWWKMNEL